MMILKGGTRKVKCNDGNSVHSFGTLRMVGSTLRDGDGLRRVCVSLCPLLLTCYQHRCEYIHRTIAIIVAITTVAIEEAVVLLLHSTPHK